MNNALIATSFSSVNITDGNFQYIEGIFMNINVGVSFYCNYCRVYNIWNQVIAANTNSSIYLINSIFTWNYIYSQNSGLISIFSPATFNNYIINCTFENNYSVYTDLLNFINMTLYIIESIFQSNTAPSSNYCGMSVLQSALYINSSTFHDQSSTVNAAFLFIQKDSNASIISSIFSGGSATYGGAIDVENSYLSISSSSFNNNSATLSGGHIFAIDSSIMINGSNFTEGSSPLGDAIYMINNDLTISSSQFLYSISTSNETASSIIISGKCNANVTDTIFSSPIDNVSGLMISGAKSVYITNTRFENISSIIIGALTLVGDSANGNVNIFQSFFINNNSTGNGSAINLNDMSIVIKDSLIENNHADIDGGGLFLASPLCNNCSFSIKGETNIINNNCNRNGGAMI